MKKTFAILLSSLLCLASLSLTSCADNKANASEESYHFEIVDVQD